MKKILILLFVALLFSCDEDDEQKFFFVGDEEYLFIDSIIEQGDYSIVLYQYDALERNLLAGFNNLEVGFFDFKARTYTKNVDYSLNVFKYNGGDTIFAPFFADQEFNSLNLTKLPIYFTEGSETENWILLFNGTINGRNFEAKMQFSDVDFGIFQEEYEYKGENYLFTLVDPINAKTGVVPVEFALHKRIGKKYVAEENISTKVRLFNDNVSNPPGIVNPSIEDELPGHYRGLINITESGSWNLEIDLLFNSDLAYTYKREIFIKVIG